jgi:hypothetical protein
MTRHIRSALAISVIAGGLVYAQPPRRFGRDATGTKTPATPAQVAQRETDRLTRFFMLTPAQQATVLGILTPEVTELQALNAQMKPLRTTLETGIRANNQSQISATAQQLSIFEEQAQVLRANTAGQIYATVLTAAQQAQLGTGLGPLLGGGAGFGGRR